MKPSPATCTVCDIEAATPDPYYYVWRERRFFLYRCPHCTHQFVHPAVTIADQELMYNDHYFSRDGDWVCGVFQAGYIDAEARLRQEAAEILAMLPASRGRLLDIGCAGGVFLDEARKRGFQSTGIELNAGMARHAREKYNLEVLNKRIEDVPRNQWSEEFDVITFLDCLEHVPQPLEVMRKAHHWLRSDGTVFIRGPLSNRLVGSLKERLRRMLRFTKRLPGYPLDANMFNKASLGRLLEKSGFDRPDWLGEVPGFSNLLASKKGIP